MTENINWQTNEDDEHQQGKQSYCINVLNMSIFYVTIMLHNND